MWINYVRGEKSWGWRRSRRQKSSSLCSNSKQPYLYRKTVINRRSVRRSSVCCPNKKWFMGVSHGSLRGAQLLRNVRRNNRSGPLLPIVGDLSLVVVLPRLFLVRRWRCIDSDLGVSKLSWVTRRGIRRGIREKNRLWQSVDGDWLADCGNGNDMGGHLCRKRNLLQNNWLYQSIPKNPE